MYVLYELATGRAHSQSNSEILNPDAKKWGIKETSKTGIWNETTLDFDPTPKNKRMTTLSFMELFTDEELIGILEAAKVSTAVQLFVMKLEQASYMDLNYQPAINGINIIAGAGLITHARAAEILNG